MCKLVIVVLLTTVVNPMTITEPLVLENANGVVDDFADVIVASVVEEASSVDVGSAEVLASDAESSSVDVCGMEEKVLSTSDVSEESSDEEGDEEDASSVDEVCAACVDEVCDALDDEDGESSVEVWASLDASSGDDDGDDDDDDDDDVVVVCSDSVDKGSVEELVVKGVGLTLNELLASGVVVPSVDVLDGMNIDVDDVVPSKEVPEVVGNTEDEVVVISVLFT